MYDGKWPGERGGGVVVGGDEAVWVRSAIARVFQREVSQV